VNTPYKNAIVGYVARNPGCTKFAVARDVVARRCHPSKVYRVVNTAIRHGWIRAEKINASRYALYPVDQPV
jgi:hypothetical protein